MPDSMNDTGYTNQSQGASGGFAQSPRQYRPRGAQPQMAQQANANPFGTGFQQPQAQGAQPGNFRQDGFGNQHRGGQQMDQQGGAPAGYSPYSPQQFTPQGVQQAVVSGQPMGQQTQAPGQPVQQNPFSTPYGGVAPSNSPWRQQQIPPTAGGGYQPQFGGGSAIQGPPAQGGVGVNIPGNVQYNQPSQPSPGYNSRLFPRNQMMQQ